METKELFAKASQRCNSQALLKKHLIGIAKEIGKSDFTTVTEEFVSRYNKVKSVKRDYQGRGEIEGLALYMNNIVMDMHQKMKAAQ
jgi:hypothetical protein